MSEPLENDPRNPCVGCGPANPRGLRLVFRREGDAVASSLDADPTLQGWPRRLHSGVLYTALLETANWTVYGMKGRVDCAWGALAPMLRAEGPLSVLRSAFSSGGPERYREHGGR